MTQDNARLLEQLKPGFNRTFNWNKHQPKISTERPNEYLDFLIDSGFLGVNKLFDLSFENEAQRTSHKWFYLPTRGIKNYNVMIDGQNFFDQPVRNDLIRFDNIPKIATGQSDNYRTDFLLDYNYFEKYYEIMAIDLINQQVFDSDPKVIIKEAKEAVLDFSQGTVVVFQFYFSLL